MPRLRIVSELEHGRPKSTSSVIPEVLFLGGRLFDASHRSIAYLMLRIE